MSIEDQLRAAIRAAQERGWSLNALSRETGVGYSMLHAVVNGQRSPGPETVETLTGFFGSRLTKPRIPAPPPHTAHEGIQVEACGQRHNLSEWAAILGVSRQYTQRLYHQGRLIERVETSRAKVVS